MVEVAVVPADVGLHPGILVLDASIAREYALVLEISHEVVVDFGSHECRRGSRCTQFVACSDAPGQAVLLQYVGVQSGFHASIEEFARLALAIGGHSVAASHCDTVIHFAVTLHGDTGHAPGDEYLIVVQVEIHRAPELCLADVHVVVVGIFVTFFEYGVRVAHVIVYMRVAHGVVAQCVGVDIVHLLSAHQVVYFLVVLANVGSQLQAGVPGYVFAQFGIQRRCQGQIEVIVVSG